MGEDARYLKRKVKAGRLDVHPTEPAIIVFYEVEATILGDYGESLIGERKQSEKKINVPFLSASTDINKLAEQIIDRCKLIHPSKLPELEQLLVYLQQRAQSGPVNKGKKKQQQRSLLAAQDEEEPANLADLEEYIELLYEDTKKKIKGTSMMLQLARNPDNLEELATNETVMSALGRVLREEGLKSMELVTNIISIFFFFSSFSAFHELISQYKIGFTCMKVIEQENKRYEAWLESMEKRKRKYKAKKITKEDYEDALQKFADQQFQQDTLLYVAFHLLLNLAEDTRVEVKMRNKNLVDWLMIMLERENEEFLLLVITFLKKLSIFVENKEEMKEGDVVGKIHHLVSAESEVLSTTTLRLMLNLSFDPDMRTRMVEVGLIPNLVALLGSPSLAQFTVLQILYHISMDDKHKSLFSFTDCIPVTMRMLLETKAEETSVELIAFAINLAASPRNAQVMCDSGGLKFLIKRAVKTQDPLFLKICRNLAQHKELIAQFIPYVDPIARLLTADCPDDVTVEIVGILGRLSIPDFNYEQLIEEYDLIDFISRKLLPSACEDDLVLEIVIFLGTVLSDEASAKLAADADLVPMLIDLLKAKQEDDEIVLQIIYVFHRLVFYESTRDQLLAQANAVSYLIDLMHDKNPAISQTCDRALDVIMEFDANWAHQIRAKKFAFHNSQWIEMILEGDDIGNDDIDAEYMEDGYYDNQYVNEDASELYGHADQQDNGAWNFEGEDGELYEQDDLIDHPDGRQNEFWD